MLLTHQPGAVVALNRAVALDQVRGPEAVLAALDAIPLADDLTGDVTDYVYLHRARADLLTRLDRLGDARCPLNRMATRLSIPAIISGAPP